MKIKALYLWFFRVLKHDVTILTYDAWHTSHLEWGERTRLPSLLSEGCHHRITSIFLFIHQSVGTKINSRSGSEARNHRQTD